MRRAKPGRKWQHPTPKFAKRGDLEWSVCLLPGSTPILPKIDRRTRDDNNNLQSTRSPQKRYRLQLQAAWLEGITTLLPPEPWGAQRSRRRRGLSGDILTVLQVVASGRSRAPVRGIIASLWVAPRMPAPITDRKRGKATRSGAWPHSPAAIAATIAGDQAWSVLPSLSRLNWTIPLLSPEQQAVIIGWVPRPPELGSQLAWGLELPDRFYSQKAANQRTRHSLHSRGAE